MPLLKQPLAGPGYVILNVIRVMNIIALLAVIAACAVMLVKTFVVSKFFFFDAVTHVVVANISSKCISNPYYCASQINAKVFSLSHNLGIEHLSRILQSKLAIAWPGLGVYNAWMHYDRSGCVDSRKFE